MRTSPAASLDLLADGAQVTTTWHTGPWSVEVREVMIHYHGGPITPETCAYEAWRGGHAFISFARPDQIELAASICQTFALDNGAFTFWKRGGEPDWPGYYGWCRKWLAHPACDWAVIPDVIGGTEDENDALLGEWPFGHRGVPVWHLNESPERLVRLAGEWPRVALGSAAEWDVSVPVEVPCASLRRAAGDLRRGRPAGCQASRPADAGPPDRYQRAARVGGLDEHCPEHRHRQPLGGRVLHACHASEPGPSCSGSASSPTSPRRA